MTYGVQNGMLGSTNVHQYLQNFHDYTTHRRYKAAVHIVGFIMFGIRR